MTQNGNIQMPGAPLGSTSLPGDCSLRARLIVPISGPPHHNAAITLRGGAVHHIGRPAPDLPCVDLGNVALLPALNNAHTHLEFSSLSAPLPASDGRFVTWLRAVLAWRAARDAADPAAKELAVRQGVEECVRCGTVAVGEIATAWDDTLEAIAGPCHGVVYQEWISLNDERTRTILQRADEWHTKPPSTIRPWQRGVSPHAPYSASLALVEAAVERSRRWRWPLAMHIAESSEELELLASHSGPLWELLRERGVWNAAAIPRGITISDYLRLLTSAHRVSIIHGNYLLSDDWAILAAHADHMTLVHCPRTHAHFQRRPFPLATLLRAGVHVALGTDSRSSNPDLSMWRELQFAHGQYPDVPFATLLKLATVNAAEALGLPRGGGTLTPGAAAHLIAVALPDEDDADPYVALAHPDAEICGCIYDGRSNHWP